MASEWLLTDVEILEATAKGKAEYDICQCGDYRHQHENGTGKCRMSDDGSHDFTPCLSFRFSSKTKDASTYLDIEIGRFVATTQHAKTLKLLESKGLLSHTGWKNTHTQNYGECNKDCHACALLRESGK